MTTTTDERTAQRLAELDAEIRERRAEAMRLKRSLPRTPVENVAFESPEGTVHLADLFGDRDELILVFNMGRGCAWCSLWADGFTAVEHQLRDRAAFVLSSPDPVDVQQAFAAERDWRFPIVRSESPFRRAMGFEREDGKTLPGYATFARGADGSIERVASDVFGPGDPYCAVYHFLDHLPSHDVEWRPIGARG